MAPITERQEFVSPSTSTATLVFPAHELIAFGNDIPHGLAQILCRCIQIDVRCSKLQIPKKYAAEAVIIILPRMHQQLVKIHVAAFDDLREPDDLRAGPYDRHEPESFHSATSCQ